MPISKLNLGINAIKVLERRYLLRDGKGITVYRYGSKGNQVLTTGSLEKELGEKHVIAESEFAGGCDGVTCPH